MKNNIITVVLPITLITIACYVLHTYLLFTPDVGYLMTATSQLLAGGSYVTEIFETNPPMILYLYSPVSILAKTFSLDTLNLARLYVLFLLVSASGCCYFLLRRLIPPNQNAYFNSIFYGILFVYFILPLPSYLQREHILLIVLLPYVLATALAIENKSIHPIMAIAIGLFAGLGFALKSFFWITIILIEMYLMIKKRNLFAWVRIEALMIVSVIILYFISLWVFQPGYFKIMTPLILKYYLPSIKKTWVDFFSIQYVIICLSGILAYSLVWRQDKFPQLGLLLFISLIGMTVAFTIPRAGWYYHTLPAIGLTFLIIIHLAGQAINSIHRGLWILAMLVVLIYPVYHLGAAFQYAERAFKIFSSNEIINYINSQTGPRSVFCFTIRGTNNCTPLTYLTNSIYAERFPFFWWYKGIRNAEKRILNDAALANLHNDKNFLINSIADDLNRLQARWVIVDFAGFKGYEGSEFEIIDYFSENKNFKQAWRPYHYVTSIEGSAIYERK